jgi:hypothetical protein
MEDKLEKIQQEIKQLVQKQVELEKAHQTKSLMYRWLQEADPELLAVKNEIARLEKDEDNYFKILQVRMHKYIQL